MQSSDAKKVITLRHPAFAKADATGGSASIETVSGGRTLNDAALFSEVILPLANKLGATALNVRQLSDSQ